MNRVAGKVAIASGAGIRMILTHLHDPATEGAEVVGFDIHDGGPYTAD